MSGNEKPESIKPCIGLAAGSKTCSSQTRWGRRPDKELFLSRKIFTPHFARDVRYPLYLRKILVPYFFGPQPYMVSREEPALLRKFCPHFVSCEPVGP